MESGRAPNMVHYTAMVPVRDATVEVGRFVAKLDGVLRQLILPYEIVCIDDGSRPSTAGELDDWMHQYRHLRVVRFDRLRGIGASLAAGIAASRGDLIIGVTPGAEQLPETIPHLVSRLSRYDFVVAQQEQTIAQALRSHLLGTARLAAADPHLRRREALFFAGRRESLVGLALGRHAFRVLPELVAGRGFRVCQLTFGGGLPPRGAPLHSGILKRIAAGWLRRRFEPHLARELPVGRAARGPTILARTDRTQQRVRPPVLVDPVANEHGNSV